MSNEDRFLGTTAQKGFFGTVVVQAVVILTMLAVSLALLEVNTPEDISGSSPFLTIPTYFALFVLAQIFHLLLTWDALRLRNIVQIIGLLIFQMGLIIYGSIQIIETKTGLEQNPASECDDDFTTCSGPNSLSHELLPFQIVVPIVAGLSWFLLIFFSLKIYREFGWTVFRLVGADPNLKDMFRFYQIFIVLLKFDFFAFLGLTIQLLILVLKRDTAQFGVTIAAIPVIMVLLIGCGVASAREIRWIMVASLILILASWAYLIYKFCALFLPHTRDSYESTRKTIGVFIVACFMLDFATFFIGLKVFFDFGKGLLPSKMKELPVFNLTSFYVKSVAEDGFSSRAEKKQSEEGPAWTGGEPLRPRISID